MRSLALEGDEAGCNPRGVLGRKFPPKWQCFPPRVVCDGCGIESTESSFDSMICDLMGKLTTCQNVVVAHKVALAKKFTLDLNKKNLVKKWNLCSLSKGDKVNCALTFDSQQITTTTASRII